MPDRRKRVEAILKKGLNAEQYQLFQLVSVENYRDKVIFRMPAGIVNLETVWKHVVELMRQNNIDFTRSDPFATVEDLDGILSNITWIWPGWLAEGFNTLLAGDPGVGKSAVALDFVRRVTKGLAWPLTDKDGKPGNTLWIETEASQQLLVLRSKSLGVDRKRLFLPIIDGDMLAQPDIWNPDHRQQILNLIEAKEPKLVVLDSLGSASSHGENRKEDVAPLMEFFAMMARDYGTSTLIVHHLRKTSINEPPEVSLGRVRGSSAITALARTVIALDKPQKDGARLSIIKTNISKPAQPLALRFVDDERGDLGSIAYEPYVPPTAKRLKKEVVADWLEAELSTCDSALDLKDLVDRGEANGYTRQNLYAAKEVLGDRIRVTGTGNHATWSLSHDEDAEAVISGAMKRRGTS